MEVEFYKIKEMISRLPENSTFEDVENMAMLICSEIDCDYTKNENNIDFIIKFADRNRTQIISLSLAKIEVEGNEIHVPQLSTVICGIYEINPAKLISLLRWGSKLIYSKFFIQNEIIYLGAILNKGEIDINRMALMLYEIALEGDVIEEKFFKEDIN